MKILVTGGAGFIGSNFIHYILNEKEDFEIINLDLLTYAGNIENLHDIEYHKNYKFVKGDINDYKLVNSIMKDVDYVINFAAESHVDRSIENPGIFVKTNVLGTQTLLESSKNNQIKKFIQISTDEVYGSLETTDYFTEQNLLLPNSPYAASKAAADLIVRSYYKTYGLPTLISRCTNNYGPYQHPEKLIPAVILNALKNKPIPIYGDGTNIRDWIHVNDHCSAILTILEKGKIGEIYNIGSNNEYKNIDLANLILELMAKPNSLIKFVKDRLGHDKRYAIDSSKIRTELKWAPRIDFKKGISDTINWYIKNEKWIEKVLLK